MKKTPHICPITYNSIHAKEKYSIVGLRRLSIYLKNLQDLPYTVEQQLREAKRLADKLSIQGIQPKLSAKLNIKQQSFLLCDSGGTYILKPQNRDYTELPENEALTMHMAKDIMEVPLHGLLYCIDGSFTYFVKRFDRGSRGNRIPTEDFAQLSGLTRDTKYDFSMEKLVILIDKYCTFPAIEKSKLLVRVIFNYLVGNEDMHLKNYSLITRNNVIALSPAYDLVNTTIAMGIKQTKEQIALPLNGKKNNITRKDLIEYYGVQKLALGATVIQQILSQFHQLIPTWKHLIAVSFLSEQAKQEYNLILDTRSKVLDL